MNKIETVEPVNAPEYLKTTVDTCPTCISGTDPIIERDGFGVLFDEE